MKNHFVIIFSTSFHPQAPSALYMVAATIVIQPYQNEYLGIFFWKLTPVFAGRAINVTQSDHCLQYQHLQRLTDTFEKWILCYSADPRRSARAVQRGAQAQCFPYNFHREWGKLNYRPHIQMCRGAFKENASKHLAKTHLKLHKLLFAFSHAVIFKSNQLYLIEVALNKYIIT